MNLKQGEFGRLLKDNQEKIKELTARIAAVCMTCPHVRFATGRFECDRKKSECHSGRVRKWLAEINALEKGGKR